MISIREISAMETFEVRHPVLRSGKPIESCYFEGDDLPSTKHFGLFENENLLGVISLFEIPNLLFDAEKQIQLRGMAVLENHRNKKFGEMLINRAEDFAQQQQVKTVWFNARENAVGFYKKMGYSLIGAAFEIDGIGLHYVMFKNLTGNVKFTAK